MSDSYPTIQETLSPMQREFLGCVEMHLDPPDDDTKDYEVEALYHTEGGAGGLPGPVVRFRLAVHDSMTEDVTERRHMIEFLDSDEGAPVARITHSMKRIESWGGRMFWTESHFQVKAPDVPDSKVPQRMVEREVEEYLDRIRALDRGRRLRET